MKSLETEINGHKYIIIHEEIERKEGFARGSELSKFVINLKKMVAYSPEKKFVIKNTTEDLDFYDYLIRKVPNIYFTFDKVYAEKHSKNTMVEWDYFITAIKHKVISVDL